MSSLAIRRLSKQERTRAFATGSYVHVDLTPYANAIREMEGGVAYGITLNGATGRSVKVRMNKAAKQLDLRLHWAAVPKDAAELIVELQP